MRKKQNKLVPFTYVLNKETQSIWQKNLGLKGSCKIIKTNTNIFGHVITYERKFLPNMDMKLCEIFVVLELALKQSRFNRAVTAIGKCYITFYKYNNHWKSQK